jgi:hypothetical protein
MPCVDNNGQGPYCPGRFFPLCGKAAKRGALCDCGHMARCHAGNKQGEQA